MRKKQNLQQWEAENKKQANIEVAKVGKCYRFSKDTEIVFD